MADDSIDAALPQSMSRTQEQPTTSSHDALNEDLEGHVAQGTSKKSLSFHLSFLALNISVLIVSLDATVLAIAIPVFLTVTPIC